MHQHRKVLALAALLAAVGMPALSAGADERGVEIFQLCAQCHGPQGGGSRAALAPPIAGMESWYVELQLRNFRTGARGLHPDDRAGLRMYPMSQTLADDADLAAVAAYVAGLPARPAPAEIEGGDAERGKVLYTPCGACHGPGADGVQPLGGPNLKISADWYLLQQLHNYRAGIRGTNPGDAAGMRMRPMAMILADEQAMKDVIAYILSLDGAGK